MIYHYINNIINIHKKKSIITMVVVVYVGVCLIYCCCRVYKTLMWCTTRTFHANTNSVHDRALQSYIGAKDKLIHLSIFK